VAKSATSIAITEEKILNKIYYFNGRRVRRLEVAICDLKLGWPQGGAYAFTEHGVLKLSSVLNSERAINVNIQIVFEHLKQLLNPPQEPRPRIGFRRPGEEE